LGNFKKCPSNGKIGEEIIGIKKEELEREPQINLEGKGNQGKIPPGSQ